MKVAVIGCGLIGRAWANVFARAGAAVNVWDPVDAVRKIARELVKYDPALGDKPRWLVLNKIDALPDGDAAKLQKDIVRRLRWKAPVFSISAVSGEGCQPLIRAISDHLAAARAAIEAAAQAQEAASAAAAATTALPVAPGSDTRAAPDA
jgi:GTP-binding protein